MCSKEVDDRLVEADTHTPGYTITMCGENAQRAPWMLAVGVGVGVVVCIR